MSVLCGLLFAFGAIVLAQPPYSPDSFPDCQNGPLSNTTVCDVSADPLTRATALLNMLTLQEKLNNTGNVAPGVPRLGVPAYNWWQEGLHGVASSPGVNFSHSGNFSYATSFPQPILMSAAFDDQLITDVATVISTEARAFNNAGRAGLDFWTPNINPFKDPRWGRGQETPGEDAYHLASYVHALIDGLQGGYDPKYKRIVATCKHWAGYDMETWNGNFRYQFDAQITIQDLVEYYFPPFESCARDSNVGAFMCSYNAVNGVPTCADSYLLQTVLRQHWGWTNENQWVTSDCDAIQNIFLPHEYAATREQAAADALNAGTDLNCGTFYQDHLPGALAQGLITEDTLNQALIRQYSSLMRLGYFDPPSSQPYRQLGWSDVSTPYAEQLALTAAEEGITLLKNDGLLPISSLGSVALIGDWSNASTQMQGNYYGIAPYLRTPLFAFQNVTTVYWAQGIGGQGDPTTNNWLPVWTAANKSDMIVYVGGIDNSVESEGNDRNNINWMGDQLDMIGQLASYGKPMIVVAMGAGQIDSSAIINNPNISALLWAGYPGQSGGDAIVNIITGKMAPAGRLPTTQYPADYIQQVSMTNMALRPGKDSPGRTYKWYSGKPIFDFGFGLHYTNFSVSIPSGTFKSSYDVGQLLQGCNPNPNNTNANTTGVRYADQCPFISVPVSVQNTGSITSDYSVLGFLTGKFGPEPYPNKALVNYQRLHNMTGGSTQTATLNLTLASLARVDDNGNKVVYPGSYTLQIDTQPLTSVDFTLTGQQLVVDQWPAPPPYAQQNTGGVGGVGPNYYVPGYGSEETPV